MKIVDIQQDTPEWHQFRLEGLGSSDVAAIMGKSPWKTALELFEEKIGQRNGPISTRTMQRGKDFEPEARRYVEHLTGISYPPLCCMHDFRDFCRASLDGYNAEASTILEIKVPTASNFRNYSIDIPEHYMIQLQWQIYVSGAKMALFCVYSPEALIGYVQEVERDELMIDALFEAASIFWHNLQNGIPPSLQRKDFLEIDDPEFQKKAELYKALYYKKKLVELEMEILKKELLEFGDDGNFKGFGISCIRTPPRVSYDIEAMKLDGIAVEKYRKLPKEIGSYTIRIDKN